MTKFALLVGLLLSLELTSARRVIVPSVPKNAPAQNVYRPPPRVSNRPTPRPTRTVYRPITRTRATTQDSEETPDSEDPQDPCGVPGLEYLCPESQVDSPTITNSGCAATDQACLNCGLAYLSQAAAANYDPYIFQRPFEYQAAALCYQIHPVSSTLVWAPGYYDAPYSYCYNFWSSMGEPTSAYWASYFQGFCTVMGDVIGVPSMFTEYPTIIAAVATDGFEATGTFDPLETGAAATFETEAVTATDVAAAESGSSDTNVGSSGSFAASHKLEAISLWPCVAFALVSMVLAVVL